MKDMRRGQQPSKPMTVAEHKGYIDWMKSAEGHSSEGDDLLHDLLVGMYPLMDSQKS